MCVREVNEMNVGYVRVSSVNQEGGDGFTRQENVIFNSSYNVGKIYKEVMSGVKHDRPVLTRLIDELPSGSSIVVEACNRLSRSLIVQEMIIDMCEKKDISIVSVSEGELSGNESRILIRQISGAVSQYEKSMIVNRLRVARERVRVEKGKCEGRVGYSSEFVKYVKSLVRISKNCKRSYNQIADILNTEGYRSDNGLKFNKRIVYHIVKKC